jgi:hypothetical protein
MRTIPWFILVVGIVVSSEARASPLLPQSPLVTLGTVNEPILVHHRPWHKMKTSNRGRHLGWTRGKHKGWSKGKGR